MKLATKSQARKIGGTIYVKIDPYFVKRGMVKEGDWIDFEILNVQRNELTEDEEQFAKTSTMAEFRAKKRDSKNSERTIRTTDHPDALYIIRANTPRVLQKMRSMGGC